MIRSLLRAPIEARTWQEFRYVLVGLCFALPVVPVAVVGIAGVIYSLVTIGLPLLVGALLVFRHTVRWFRLPARWLLGLDWPSPAPRPTSGGVVRFVESVLRDGTAWRAFAYGIVKFPLMFAATYLGGSAALVGVLATTYPAWWFLVPLDRTWAGTWWFVPQGVALVLVFPWVIRLLVGLDRLLIRALLEPHPDATRIAALEASRAALRADSAAVLRRVERNLHDGTQARLVGLGVTLSRIEARVDDGAVRSMVADAQDAVVDALTELRDIVRGLHPPALDDGLPVAIETLAGRGAVPVDVHIDLTGQPPDAIASALYFTAGELLTNVSRHAGATRARLDLREEGEVVRLVVADDGRGGARLDPHGSGLVGLRRRAVALDGTLDIDSPTGGPTTVTVTLPKEA
ncbi:sensor histidine kinase [Cryptosporangium aurantiacum]|uniref:histidine kinase n=1 Tax=Cryptosporangium aurantiacum TaxID=134849 RepID=A0A1M7QMB0_9ACTN|nr:sensor domain-containing protein [Cryptosporangium aurantiacum]SHN32199.1 Signal transduction histidine kinase [Cryptosporangium aurantiacum]